MSTISGQVRSLRAGHAGKQKTDSHLRLSVFCWCRCPVAVPYIFGAGNRTRFAFSALRKIEVSLRRAVASNSPPACCIYIGSGPASSDNMKNATPFGVAFFMVPVTGLEPVRFLRRGILSPLCLPISPYRRHGCYRITFSANRQVLQLVEIQRKRG